MPGWRKTRSGGITQISALLAQVLEQKEGTVFQRLREWYLDAEQKRGVHRRALDVTTCFGPLLGWIVTRWSGEDKHLALALDATTLGNRWIVLQVECPRARVCHSGCLEGTPEPCQRILAFSTSRASSPP